ncbi:MAG TPA: hypothetical protein VII56_13210 [Rhizomicrobium sp.]
MSTYSQIGNERLVLAVYPTSRGFGWVLFSDPLSPVDWGVASAKTGRNARLVRRFERILRRHEPSVFVVEDPIRRCGRSEQVLRLHQDFVHLALLNGVDVAAYPQHVVAQHFSHVGATTKYEIAQFIASKIEAFDHRLPRKRRAYEGEQHHQALFDAAALALTYFAKTSEPQ